MIIHSSLLPLSVNRLPISFTTPDTELWILVDIKPFASPIFCPTKTLSPFFTIGVHGIPICCDTGNTSSLPGNMTSMFLSHVISL